MPAKKLIAFSTTRQWNPGDEFIFRGIRNCLVRNKISFNTVVYNRNPITNPDSAAANRSEGTPNLWENSFSPEHPIPLDYAIFAGTPEWASGSRVERFLHCLLAGEVRCSFLGVGLAGPMQMPPVVRQVLSSYTDAFVCRDQLAFDAVCSIVPDTRLATCPSILSADTCTQRGSINRIGCVIQGTRVLWQSIPAALQASLYAQYAALAARYEVEFIAHFIDDLAGPLPLDRPVHYSSISDDYFEIYDRFDLVISPRVHGCGIAASLGIPSICVAHDGRAPAARLLGALIVDETAALCDLVQSQDWAARSERIIDIRLKSQAIYDEVVSSILVT